MVPDTLVRVSEMMDTPPIQNDYALFYYTQNPAYTGTIW